ncbi:MAG TPA: family 20 glycosylhydrolase [Bacteroidales bacterium]|nr:family 20 glycosylhydrolase [Bacteroidales bacterium]
MKILFLLMSFLLCSGIYAQNNSGHTEFNSNLLPVRGFCIAAPRSEAVTDFTKFIEKELAPASVNTLILRVDWNYMYKTHPELRDSSALTDSDVNKIVSVCQKYNIRIIPQVNLLGHQSWAGTTGNLLREYPEFDETPEVKMPEKYVWPNADGLYCKSYCPLHPEVHDIVFDVVDEICDVFKADAFHAGMDEVFYIGERQCPRCTGKDKAELFAGEVRLIRDHLAAKGRQLWIWGDRLIDGRTTGLGEWEASFNNTYRAIDMIPKDVMICDWHYERPDQTAVYFAMKGFNVVTCPWNNPGCAVHQAQDMVNFRENSSDEMRDRFQGIVQTVWSGAEQFMKSYYQMKSDMPANDPARCFKQLYSEINRLAGISAKK